jgi:hypothetical protein
MGWFGQHGHVLPDFFIIFRGKVAFLRRYKKFLFKGLKSQLQIRTTGGQANRCVHQGRHVDRVFKPAAGPHG